jgi:hypothetical protein
MDRIDAWLAETTAPDTGWLKDTHHEVRNLLLSDLARGAAYDQEQLSFGRKPSVGVEDREQRHLCPGLKSCGY